jgi:DTW domain-containing protein YfiP
MHKCLCICAELPRIATRTRIVVLIHSKEQRKPTNTGRMAVECLQNAELVVRGDRQSSNDRFSPAPSTLPLLLFPTEDARPLSEFVETELPVTLVVPDGNWRQASKFRRRVQGLADLPAVTLPTGPATCYRLRHESRNGGLATMEAIARALGILDGVAVETALMRVFSLMVTRTLWSRGAIDSVELGSALPEGAVRHDPLSGPVRAEACLPVRRDRC